MTIISDDGADIWIRLPSGQKTVISKADEWILSKFPIIGITGSRSGYAFVERAVKTEYSTLKERIYLHRVIVGLASHRREKVDHKDGDRLNNRRSNLRVCSMGQNAANTPARKGKKYKGVFFDKRLCGLKKRHAAYISYIDAKQAGQQTRKYLGRFHTAEEAAKAYDKAAKEVWGDFAFQNFPSSAV